jgi:prepilin-type N-terminal cleavage/methylation domain-containing protein
VIGGRRAAGASAGRGRAGFPDRGRAGLRRAGRAGFTLIELMAVVVIVVLLYGMVVPNLDLRGRRTLDGEGEVLRGDIELARQRAIATGTPHRLAIDLDLDRVHLERFEPTPPPSTEPRDPREPADLTPPRPSEGSFQPLPTKQGRGRRLHEDVFFASIETPEGPVDRGIVGLGFFQDGSATPARIRLANADGDALELEVLPLAETVRVRVVQ